MIGDCHWMVFTYRGSCCLRGYSWRLSTIRLRVSVRRKERKYSLIWPFWLDTRVEVFIWIREIDLGRAFSIQVRSSSREAVFWLRDRFTMGMRRCITVGKYPSMLENLNGVEGCLNFRFCVARLRSIAMVKPRIVTARAVIFRYHGIVIWGTVIGGMVLVMKKPAKILPIRRRLMEFIR